MAVERAESGRPAGHTKAPSDPIAELIRDGRHRDAIAMCAKEYSAALGRMAMAMLGSQAEAEETVQEALLAAYDALDTYRAEGSVKSWLFGITRRMCAKRIDKRVRRQRRLEHVVGGASEHAETGFAPSTPDTQLEKHQRAEALRVALDTLKPTERDVVVMRYQSELSYSEIAAICSIDEPAARKRISRALQKLRAALDKQASQGATV